MREYSKKRENQSRTLDSSPRVSKQAPIADILQAYMNGTLGRQRVQRESVADEELLQAKTSGQAPTSAILQRYAPEEDEEEILQGKFETDTQTEQEPVKREEKANNTGLPDNLKAGIENFSGFSMDDVKVHYNSNKPAQLNALAYAQGTDIHVAPGQKQHLPHEAWHVVQQKQGRVQPTMQLQGINVNDNEELEREADVMGGNIIQLQSDDESEDFEEDNKIEFFLESLVQSPISAYEIDYYKKAHGDNISKTKDITDAQKNYQNWLLGKVDSRKIMDCHRSIGFEYEFATYKILKDSLNIESHIDLGRSRQLSNLFKTPFKLETDAENELEIVTPPFIIADINDNINRNAGSNIFTSYRDAAKKIRDKNIGKRIEYINMVDEGFGNIWTFSNKAHDLEISQLRDKHEDSKDKIYSQMNISLTPEEISDFMEKQSKEYVEDLNSETLNGTEIFSKAYFRIWNLLNITIQKSLDCYYNEIVTDPEKNLEQKEQFCKVESKVKSINILISKALSNILALPSIICNQKYRARDLLDSKHSSVKETFGIWVKDTIQNILYHYISDDQYSKAIVKLAINTNKELILEILYYELLSDENDAFPKVNQIDDPDYAELQDELDSCNTDFANQVKQEAAKSLELILKVLDDKKPEFKYDSKFLKESFNVPNAGYGVRKDTFIEIMSGSTRKLHLGEIRGDEILGKYLNKEEIDLEDDDIIEWIR